MADRYTPGEGVTNLDAKHTGSQTHGQANTPPPGSADAPPKHGATVRIKQGPVRVQVDAQGNVHVRSLTITSHQAGAEVAEGEALLGRSSYGAPLDASQWNDDTRLYHPSIGDGRARDLVAAGLVVKTADGYKLATSAPAPQQPEQTPEQKAQAEKDATADAAIAAKLPGTSAESDAFMQKVTEGTSQGFVDAAVNILAKGGNLEGAISEAANRTGQEPEAVRAGIDQRIAEGTRAAKAAVAALGVSDFEAFTADLWRNPEAGHDVVSAMARNDVAPLLKAARAYVECGGPVAAAVAGISDADVYAARLGEGVTVSQGNNGKPVLTINGERMSLAEAVERGLVKVTRG